MFVGEEVVIVPAVFEVNTIDPELPPPFFTESEDGFTISLQPPEPLPVTGGPGVPAAVVSQSKVLLCAPVPVTMVLDDTPEVVLTLA